MQFKWDKKKNELLKKERGISFEELVFSIENGFLLDLIENPNRIKYPNQKIYIVRHKNYVYTVPAVKEDDITFLKTAFKNRKYNKRYFETGDNKNETR
jgi:hypothetical protein